MYYPQSLLIILYLPGYSGKSICSYDHASLIILYFIIVLTAPAPPGVKPFGGMKPTGSTITVQFSLPEDHETIR